MIHVATKWKLARVDAPTTILWSYTATAADDSLTTIRIPISLQLVVNVPYVLSGVYVSDTGVESDPGSLVFIPTIGAAIYGLSIESNTFAATPSTGAHVLTAGVTNTGRTPIFITSPLMTTLQGVPATLKEVTWELRTLANVLVTSGTTKKVLDFNTNQIVNLSSVTFNASIHRPVIAPTGTLESGTDYKLLYTLKINEIGISSGQQEVIFKTGKLLAPAMTIVPHPILPEISISAFTASVLGIPDTFIRTRWVVKDLTSNTIIVEREATATSSTTPTHNYIKSIAPTKLVLKNVTVGHSYQATAHYVGTHYGNSDTVSKTFDLNALVIQKPSVVSVSSKATLTPFLSASLYTTTPADAVKSAMWEVKNQATNAPICSATLTSTTCHIYTIPANKLTNLVTYSARVKYTGNSGASTEWSNWFDWQVTL